MASTSKPTKTIKQKAYEAKVKANPGTAGSAHAAAHKYVSAGLKNTGLSNKAKTELYNKLKPIVENRIRLDLQRTATRGAIQVRNQEMNAKKAATQQEMNTKKNVTKKIIGGK